MDEDDFNEFMSFLKIILQYLNSNEMSVNELYSSFHNDIKVIYTDIKSVLDVTSSEYNSLNSIYDLLELYNAETSNSGDTVFETYWGKYGLAKCYWDGYMPSLNSAKPSTRNVNKNLGLWRGDNYYVWSEEGAKYILGTNETPQATFYMLNLIGVGLFGIAILSGSFLFARGLFGNDVNSVGFLALGGGLSLFGFLICFALLWYDWTVLNYFLFGSNAYLECLRTGNVDFIVNVVNETGNYINTSCTVIARSTDAFGKENEPVYPGFDNVSWSVNEFEYQMVKISNYNSDKYSVFSLHSAQESPDRWEKAVPPPGIWDFTVNADGYKEEKYILKEEIHPGNCFNITIKLEGL